MSIDIILIGSYFLLLILVSIFTSKKEGKEDFLIGNRSISAFQAMASIGSSLIGAGMLLSYIALVFTHGAGALWLFLGYVLGFAIFYRFAKHLKPIADKERFYTMPDYFTYKFGDKTGKLSAIILILITLGWVAVNFIGGGRIVESFSGVSFELSTIIVAVIITVYLFIGGFKAVVMTDVVQFLGMLLLIGILVYLLINYSVHLTAESLNIFNISPVELISFFLVGVIVPLASSDLWQRIYAVKSVKEFRKSTSYLSIILVLIGVILLFIGLIIRSQLPDANPDTALVDGFKELLPLGWSGLAVIVVYSCIMSSADSYLFAATSSITQDILSSSDNKNIVWQTRIWLLLFVALAVIIAIATAKVLDASYFLVALMFVTAFAVIAAWNFKVKASQILFGFFFGMLAVFAGIFISGLGEMLILFAVIGFLVGLVIGSFIKLKN